MYDTWTVHYAACPGRLEIERRGSETQYLLLIQQMIDDVSLEPEK